MLTISNQVSDADFKHIYHFLSRDAYWCKNIPEKLLKKALSQSLCFVLKNNNQEFVGFARVVTDYVTFANLLDVFISPHYRSQKAGTFLIKHIMRDSRLQGLRRFTLATKDAHKLYEKVGFKAPKNPAANMEIYHPDCYLTDSINNSPV